MGPIRTIREINLRIKRENLMNNLLNKINKNITKTKQNKRQIPLITVVNSTMSPSSETRTKGENSMLKSIYRLVKIIETSFFEASSSEICNLYLNGKLSFIRNKHQHIKFNRNRGCVVLCSSFCVARPAIVFLYNII